MISNPFIGTWTYRSFHNKPEEVEDFNDIRLWQADLTLEADGSDLVKGQIGSGGYDLDIHGSISTDNGIPSIKFRAVGVSGTQTSGWVYDYVGVLSPIWPDGDQQRPAIVGAVIRSVPHSPNRQAGLTYSFVAVNKTTPAAVYQLPQSVTANFADRVHRLHHAVWHGIRGSWNGLTKEEQEALANLDWRIPGDRVALISPAERTRPAVTNGSGEDFLFFHRQMVIHYKMLMAEASETPNEWTEIPQPGAGEPNGPANAVPPMWSIAQYPNVERRFTAVKSDSFYWSRMRWWDYQFKDPTYLASLTLGEFGAIIEFSVHNDMHIRWSATPRDPDTNELLPLGRPDEDISTKWDNPRYDWLGEFYSSHINPVFWRLHGWIDDRIEDWYAAHELKHPGKVERVQKGGVQWFVPGDWVLVENPWVWPESLGGYGHGHDHHDPDLKAKRIASAEKAMAILFPPPAPPAALKALTIDRATTSIWLRNPNRTSVIGF